MFRWGCNNIPPCSPGLVLASVQLVTLEAVPVLEGPAAEGAGDGLVGSVLINDMHPQFPLVLVDVVAQRAAPANFKLDHLGLGLRPVLMGLPPSPGRPVSTLPRLTTCNQEKAFKKAAGSSNITEKVP